MKLTCLAWTLAVGTISANAGISPGGNGGICGKSLGIARSVFADPLKHAKSIHDRARANPLVTINHERIGVVATQLGKSDFRLGVPRWDVPPYLTDSSFDQMFAYYLTLSSINFMYLDPATGKTFSRGKERGAGLLAHILTENWQKISAPGFLSSFTLAHAEKLFAADHPLPNLPDRVRFLNAVGKFLEAHRGVSWLEWVKAFPRALDVAIFVHKEIDGFDDPFLKRAQIFVGMLTGRFYESPNLPENLRRSEGMTIYADYILPMVLRRMGILDYSRALGQRIDGERLVPAGTPGENEIRAATILAADRLLHAINQTERFKNAPSNILALDAALWLQGGEIEFPGSRMPEDWFVNPTRPHHRTVTTDY